MRTTNVENKPQSERKRFGFSKSFTLRRKSEFRRVFDHGSKAVTRSMVVYGNLRDEPEVPSRLGMAVSKKFGNAVKRNRARRLIRESFRLHRHHWPIAHDWIIIPRAQDFPNHLDDVAKDLSWCMKKIASRTLSS